MYEKSNFLIPMQCNWYVYNNCSKNKKIKTPKNNKVVVGACLVNVSKPSSKPKHIVDHEIYNLQV